MIAAVAAFAVMDAAMKQLAQSCIDLFFCWASWRSLLPVRWPEHLIR